MPSGRGDAREEATPIVFVEAPPLASPVLADDGQSAVVAAVPAAVGNPNTSSDAPKEAMATVPRQFAASLAPWLPWVSLAWLGGVVLVSVRHFGGWVGVQRLRWVGTTEVAADLTDRARRLMDRMRISRPVRILQSGLTELPIVVGWLRPVVLLPAGLLTGLSPRQLEAILAHELAHVRRYDYLINLLQTAIETLLFYHPAVWWLSRRIRIEREHCCDDVAVDVCGNNVDYAEALAAVEQRRAAALAMAIGGRGRVSTALVRVRRVLGIAQEDKPHRTRTLGAGLIALSLVVALVGYLAVAGEDAEGRPQEQVSRAEGNPSEAKIAAAPQPEDKVGSVVGRVLDGASKAKEVVADSDRPGKESAASRAELRTAERLVDKIVSADFKPGQMHPLDFSWTLGGGMVVNDFGYHHAMMVQNWERHATSDERMDADVKKLIAIGPDVADLINRKLRDVPPEHPAAARLALVLRAIGTKDSVPVLIDLMRRATAKTEAPNPLFARQTTLLACTSALWQITGRPLCHAPDAWQQWWNAVQDIFLPARDQKNRGVDESQVLPLVQRFRSDQYVARERLIVLGPNAVPHLRGALDAASDPTRMKIVWVMDELNATGQIPAELRRSYFVDRLGRQVASESFHLPIHERARLRALRHCSFADFCRIAIEVDRKYGQRGANGEMWGWVKMNSRLFRRLFGTVTPGETRVWAGAEPLEGAAESVAEAVPVLIEALDQADYASRKAASELAAMIGFTSHEKPEALIQRLEQQWLKEEHEHLRYDIGLAMARFQTPEVHAAVKRGLWSDRAEIVADSARLVDWSDMRPASRFPEVYDRLVDLTRHGDERVRSNSVRTLRDHAGQR